MGRGVLLVVLALAAVAVATGTRSTGPDRSAHSLYRVERNPFTSRLVQKLDLDIWTGDGSSYTILIEDAAAESFRAMLPSTTSFACVYRNIQRALDAESELLSKRQFASTRNDSEWFVEYHTLEEAFDWYADKAAEYSDLVTFVPSIGVTHEGRDLFAVRVTGNATESRKQIWLQANIHAREWITSATLQFVFNELLTRYDAGDDEVVGLLNEIEFIIIPFVNPDGFSYTWTNDRLWRKNRRDNGNSFGVDLNRNYDEHWGEGGSSATPSSDTYRGPSAASEPEVQALTKYFLENSNIIGAVDIHSYGQLILRPYAWTREDPPHEEQLAAVGDGIREAILSVHGKKFTSDNWYTGLYESSGVASDWFHGDVASAQMGRRPYGFTIELRPTTVVPGFQLPPDEIIPSGEEVTAGLLYFARAAIESPVSFP